MPARIALARAPLQEKMLAKYFARALEDAGLDLPKAEVRDLTFLADPKCVGWITKESFLNVMVRFIAVHAPIDRDSARCAMANAISSGGADDVCCRRCRARL